MTLIGGFLVVVGLLLSLLGIQTKKNSEAQAKLLTVEADKKDAVLAQQQTDVNAQIDAEKAKTEAEKAKPLSQDETVDFLKKL